MWGFGENICKYLGYNENDDNNKYVLIEELNGRKINQFFGHHKGNLHVYHHVIFAKNNDNEIYFWGSNKFGELGRGFKTDQQLCPKLNENFGNNLIEIRCSDDHCLAPYSDGVVYGWGHNDRHQISGDDIKFYETPTPIEKLEHRIKSICCFFHSSIALTLMGLIYFYDSQQSVDYNLPGEIITKFNYGIDRILLQTSDSLYLRDKNVECSKKNRLQEYFRIFFDPKADNIPKCLY